MMELLVNVSNLISPIFYKVLYMSMVGSILGILIFSIMQFFDNELSARSRCLIWLIPLLFFIFPISRIQINTSNDLVISSVINQVEDSIYILSSKQEGIIKDLQQLSNKDSSRKETKQQQSNLNETLTNISKVTNKMVMYTIVPIVWLIGTSITIIMMMIGNINLGYQVAKAKKVEDNAMKLILMKCKARLAITKKIEIKLQKQHTSPCIYGVIRPKILVSEEFMTRDSDVIENVFMHELSHYKRKDMITNYLLIIVTAIHWFNPFVYGFFKKIRQEMELATDEIALSKMNKEQKKQYGLTLISLLQTYETDKVATKMLCITDDNKNMERRIQKIKLATKLKKYRKSIIMLITSIVICMVIPFVLKPSNLANSLKQEERYEQVRQYLVDLEQRNHDLDNEESLTKGDYVETIIDIVKLGMKQNGDQIDVYVLAFIKSYNKQDNITINENSMPYKFIIKDDKIVDYQIPEEGENYEKSLEKIFPDDIRKQIEESQEKINQEKNESEYNINLNENYNLQE